MPLWYWIVMATCFGACVGSFLNVVIYRLPEGKSLWYPPSSDPATGDRLKWWENIPILSWLMLRGRSRYSGQRISVQYPLVELATAILFGGLTAIVYLSGQWPAMGVFGPEQTWVLLIVHLVLAAALLASTVVDAKLFIIPLQVPWFASVCALALPVAVAVGWMPFEALQFSDMTVTAAGFGAAMGGTIGLLIAVGLLNMGLLPQSFADEQAWHEEQAKLKAELENHETTEEAVTDDVSEKQDESQVAEGPEQWLLYPHGRREMIKESLFVAFPLVGMIIGWQLVGETFQVSPTLATLGAVLMGYLIGGGLIWLTRIGGTILFGKEAMGLGDVHLLAAIGAVLGWKATVMVFFMAPFFGLAAALVTIGISAIKKREVQAIPYGPYLAAAALLVMALNQTVRDNFPF